jgi:hypothetical protein
MRNDRIEAGDVTVNERTLENSVTTKRILGYRQITAEDAQGLS